MRNDLKRRLETEIFRRCMRAQILIPIRVRTKRGPFILWRFSKRRERQVINVCGRFK